MFSHNFLIVITNILTSQHADDAQQAFSSGSRPSLHNALPAIETLYAAWQSASTKPRYAPFVPALMAAMEKLHEYYKRMAESDAHIISMGLCSDICFYIMLTPLYYSSSQPSEEVLALQEELGSNTSGRSKRACPKKGTHWDSGRLSKYLPCEQFIERYKHLHKPNTTSQSQAKKRTTPTKKGRRRNVDDTASEDSDTGGDLVDPTRPWIAEWNLYVNTNETIAKDMGIVQWWGVRSVYLKIYSVLNSCLAQCPSISYMGVSRTRLPSYHGIICFEREGLFVGWNHH